MATISLRLPDDLHATAKAKAKEQERSLNWYIVHILKQAVLKKGAAK